MNQAHLSSKLLKISAAINSSLDVNEILQQTCQTVVELFGVSHCGLALFDPAYSTGTVVAEYPRGAGLTQLTFPLTDVPFEQDLIRTGEIVKIPDVSTATSLGTALQRLLAFNMRSMLIVPILSQGRVIGSFGLDAIHQPRQFTAEEEDLCRNLANLVSVALEKARLLDEARQGREQMSSLYEASNKILASADLDAVLRRIMDVACQALGAWFAVIVLMDESRRPRLMATSSGLGHLIDPQTGVRSTGISAQVFDSGVPIFMADITQHAADVHPQLIVDGIRAAACLPLTLMNGRIGVLWIHYAQPHDFTAAEKQALQLYANQSAIAYGNAQRMRELARSSDAADAMANAQNTDDVLRRIARNARLALGADYAFVYRYNATTDQFLTDETLAENVPPELKHLLTVSGVVSRRVLRDGYAKVSNLTDPALPEAALITPPAREFLDALGIQAFQGVRLEADGELLGVLYVDHKQPRGFNREDRQTLERFAKQGAIWLKKALTLKALERTRAALHEIATISVSGNLENTLQAVVTHAREALQCDIVTVYAFDPTEQRFTQASSAGCADESNMRTPQEITPASALWEVVALANPHYEVVASDNPGQQLPGRFAQAEGVMSRLGIQLRYGERCVGVMFINFRSEHAFSTSEIHDAQEMAHHAALAIRNAQLRGEVTRRASVLKTLYESGMAVMQAIGVEDTLAQVAYQVMRVAGASHAAEGAFCHVALLRGSQLEFKAASADDILLELQQSPYYQIDIYESGQIGVAGMAALTGQVINVGDVRERDDYIPFRMSTRSQLSAPLKQGEQVIGVISLEHPEVNAFGAEDERNLELVASQAAAAVHEARLYDQLRHWRTAIRDITLVSSSGDLRKTLEAVAEHARRELRCDLVTLYPYDDQQRRFVDVIGAGYRNTANMQRPHEISADSVLWRVIALEQPFYSLDPRLLESRTAQAEHIQTALGVQLRYGDQRVGVLLIGYSSSYPLTQTHIDDAVQFGHQAAIAIRNAQLRQETARRADILAALYESGRAINATLNEEDTLNQVAHSVLRVVGRHDSATCFSHVALLEGRKLTFVASSYNKALDAFCAELGPIDLDRGARHDRRVGIVGRVAVTGLPQRVGNVNHDIDYLPCWANTCSQLSVPLKLNDQVIGVVSIEDQQPDAFSAEDVRNVELVAAQAAAAIRNTHSYERVERSREAARIAARVSTLGHLEDTLRSNVRGACQALHCDIATLYTFDVHEQHFTHVESHGCYNRAHLRSPRSVTNKDSILWHILTMQEDHYVSSGDADQDDLVRGAFVRDERVKSLLALPLRYDDQPVGVMFVDYREPHHFSDDEIHDAVHFGDQAAVAIHTALRDDEVNLTERRLNARTALAWVGMAANKWRHSIEGDAITIRYVVTLIRQALAHNPEAAAGLDKPTLHLARQLDRIDKLALKIQERPITPPLSSEEGVADIQVNTLVYERMKQLQSHDQYKEIRFSTHLCAPPSAIVRASADWLQQAFDIVVDNAAKELKHVRPERRHITVTTRLDDAHVVVTFEDGGRGIPPAVKNQLFNKLVVKPGSHPGLGMGLLMAQAIVEMYQGAISIEDGNPYGTKVNFRLPLQSV